MKKNWYCILVILLAFCFCGCSKKTDEISGYQISYKNEDGLKLVEQDYAPEAEGGTALVQELLDRVSHAPNISVMSCIPESVSILGFELKEQHLMVNLDQGYSKLDKVSQVLLRAAVVKTLVQIPEVLDVTFKVNGNAMLDEKGNEMGVLGASDFIDSGNEGINSYQYAALTLYFADQNGDRIVKEMRNVHYADDTSLEKVVVEQLQSGPVNEELYPVIPENAGIIDISIKKDVCTINFDEKFNQEVSNAKTKPETTIYAIVNALCDACAVTEVQIQIEGNSDAKYRDSVSLAEPFVRNKDIILIEESSEEAVDEVTTQEQNLEPDIGVDPILKESETSTKKGE